MKRKKETHMQAEEILQHFYETEVEKRRLKHLLALEDFFQASKDELAEEFRKSFQTICRQLQQQQSLQQKGPIGHITFSMLRTELLEGRHHYLVEGTDEEWFFDLRPILTTYDASWALSFLEQFVEELYLYSKTFMGAITQADIEQIKLKEVTHFHQYVISLARYALPDIIRCPEYLALDRDAAVEIRIGEFLDVNEVVYSEDFSSKDIEEIKAWLAQKLEDEYAYEVFSNLNLSGGNYEDLDIQYAFFQKTNLAQSQLRNCLLIGANLRDSKLMDADLSFSTIHEADFSNSQLQGANFQQAQGASGLTDRQKWEMPGYLPVRFTDANLEGADFELANLRGASFIGANVKNAHFEGANLEKAVFSKEAREHLKLDPFQIASVIWK
ncbi:pentapeptide repeat-containing protein [Lysinibacillus xylanilyticus]|uniref:pentapeptide repeat-containing protein n=1 Tax=Lysinibacillus xylanilyticus TaxID=582475 RepID=UPI0037FE2EB3